MPSASPAAPGDPYGIQQDWVDADGRPQRASDDTVRRLREVIGEPPADLERTAPVVVRPGARLGPGRFTVRCEDGTPGRWPAPCPATSRSATTGSSTRPAATGR